MPAGPRDPKFKMPSIYRPKNENCFRCKVGYYLTKSGRRERREFRLGDDELLAHKKALALAEAWLKEERRHLWNQTSFKEVFPGEAASLPVWTGMSQVEEDGRVEYLATPPLDLPGDEEDASRLSHPLPAVSLKEAAQSLLGRLCTKAGWDAKAMATYRWYERELTLGLVDEAFAPKPADVKMVQNRVVPAVTSFPVTELTLTHIENYCEYWCDLGERAKETDRETFGWRSAWNRIDAFAYLLRDLKGRVPGFTYPERADDTINEAKDTVAGALTAIFKYDPEPLLAVLAAGDDRVRLFVYLALNFGMYQSDIGQQLRRRSTEVDGGLITIDGAAYVQCHRPS